MRVLYDFISLYEFICTFGLLLLGVITQNVFILSLVAALFSKQLPEKAIKLAMSGSDINKRPKCAYDCDMINKGGCAADRGGFPSGHSTVASFMFFIILLYVYSMGSSNINLNVLVAINFIFMLLVPYARVKSNCHTFPQVIGGVILGFLWAILFFNLDKYVFSKNELYNSDKAKFFSFLSGK